LPATYDAIHRALLAGLLGNLGCKSEESAHYLGARGIKFLIHPGSALQKKAGKWIVAAEISETTRLFARCVARIEPEWLERVGAHLLKRSWFDPHWEKKAMQAIAFERITLYGIVVDARRRVNFGPLNPPAAREIFIRQALVGGEVSEEFERRWGFYTHNQQLMLEIETLEHKSRRPDVLVDDELIFAFYDRLIPPDLYSGAAFDKWRREAERETPRLLYLQREDLMRHEAAGVTSEAFPHQLRLAGVDYELAYHFEPGSPRDGVTLTVPLAQLNQIPARALRVAGARPAQGEGGATGEDAAAAAARQAGAGARVRRRVRGAGAAGRQAAGSGADPLHSAVARAQRARLGDHPDAFRPDALPAHLSFNFRLLDENGRQLGMSRQLNELRAEWGREAKHEFSELHETPGEYAGMRDWTFGELPELMEVSVGSGQRVLGYPGLVDDGDSVSLRVYDTPAEAQQAHRAGLLRLFMLQFREQLKYLEKNLPGLNQMAMQFMALGTLDELRRQLIDLSCARACLVEPWPTDAAAFRARCLEAKPRIGLLAQEICRLVGQILSDWQALQKKLPAFKAFAGDGAGYRRPTGAAAQPALHHRDAFRASAALSALPAGDRAASRQAESGGAPGAARDARLLAELAPLWAHYERRASVLARQGVSDAQLEQFRWLLEELRVQLFAQELRTPVPVSSKRLQKMWEGF
jgi:ATP-dependent helicase HrpA